MKFRFKPKLGLRTALICILVMSLLLGYFSRLVRQGKEQVAIVEMLAPARKKPYSSYIPKNFSLEATIPSWLSWLPGAKHCVAVEKLDFSGREWSSTVKVDAGQLSDINKLGSLKKLALWRTDITSGDLRALDNLKQLELLDVHQCPNLDQDAVAAEIHLWPQLQRIVLGPQSRSYINWSNDLHKVIGGGVSNKGLEALVNHPNKPVRELKIRGFNRRSMGLVLQLRQLKTLEVVPDPRTDPQLLDALAFLPNLKSLRILGIPEVTLPFIQENRKDIRVSFSSANYQSLALALDAWKGNVDTLRVTFGNKSSSYSGAYGSRNPRTFLIEGFCANDRSVSLAARVNEVGQFYDSDVSRLIVENSPWRANEESRESQHQRAEFLQNLNRFFNLNELRLRYLKPSEVPTACLRNIEHLSIENGNDADTTIVLSYCRELRSLTIRSWRRKISIVGWDRLNKIRRIFFHARFDRAPVKILEQLPNPDSLEELDFGFYRPEMSEGLVEELSRFKNLQTCFIRSEDWEWHKNLHDHLPNLTNYVERMGPSDPAEERFAKSFSQLRVIKKASQLVEDD